MNAFAAFDDDRNVLAPVLDPRVYVEPKDRKPGSENDRQWAWVKHMHQHAKRVLVFAVPNGTHIPSFAGRAKVKREGLYTGFPDNGVIWDGGIALPEWKDGQGDLDDQQIECLNKLVAMGYPCGVFRTMERCVNWLADLGAPVGRVQDGR